LDVAVVAVIASSVVGLAGVLAPPLTRRADRRHERELFVRERRAEAYHLVLQLMHEVEAVNVDAAKAAAKTSSIAVWLWGSAEVRQMFADYIDLSPSRLGPESTPADRERVRLAANAVRQRMSDELQGRAPVE
jgi:hypothetical protein